MRIFIAVLTVAVFLSGCAKRPETIAAAYVSELTYLNLSCSQLVEEQSRLSIAYTQAAQSQTDAANSDVVGVILIGIPVSTLSGSNIASQVANLKGQQEAVRKAMQTKKCSS